MKELTSELQDFNLTLENARRDIEMLTKYWQLDNVKDLINNYKKLTQTQYHPKSSSETAYKKIKNFFSSFFELKGTSPTELRRMETENNLIFYLYPAENIKKMNFNVCFLDNVILKNEGMRELKTYKEKIMFFDVLDESNENGGVIAYYRYENEDLEIESYRNNCLSNLLQSDSLSRFDIEFIPCTEEYKHPIYKETIKRGIEEEKIIWVIDVYSPGKGKNHRTKIPPNNT
jgi:hypothetical protein